MEPTNDSFAGLLFALSTLAVFLGGFISALRGGTNLATAVGTGYRVAQKLTDRQRADARSQTAPSNQIDEAYSVVIGDLVKAFSQQIIELSTMRAKEIAQVREALADQQETLDAQTIQLGNVSKALDKQSEQTNRLQMELEQTRRERDTLNRRLDAMQEQHNADRANWETERTEDKAHYERQISDLMQQIEGKEARIKDLERQLDELRKIKTGELPRTDEAAKDMDTKAG